MLEKEFSVCWTFRQEVKFNFCLPWRKTPWFKDDLVVANWSSINNQFIQVQR